MSVQFRIPPVDNLVDKQFFQVPVADGLLVGYEYDQNTRTLYQKESQIIIPSHHGFTHVAEDPVPDVTCDLHGLMSADDKCKMDALLQMRMGVLGFQGAGFPDDGGFLVGDIILAAGSEFISLERIGNTIRFTVDSPIPLNCACETCSQIFWIQDESKVRGIRPPSCNGVMPDVSAYGELEIFTLPETAILDPKDPMKLLSTKGQYPALIFKRYSNAITPGENEFHIILKRNSNLTSNVGWSFTPGSLGQAECVWFVGSDKAGKQMRFELFPEREPGLLGSVLFNGDLITKQMAVIVDYTVSVLSTNQYTLRKWDTQKAKALGAKFTATNIWQYDNPENSAAAIVNPQKLVLDQTIGLLPIGTVVDIWEFEISRTSNKRITRAFFSKQPQVNAANLWALTAAVQFGDLFTAREEINEVTGSAISAAELSVPDVRLFEKTIWGLNSFEDRLILSDDGGKSVASDGTEFRDPSGEPINNDIVADIDPSIPGLRVLKQSPPFTGDINGDGVVDDEDLRILMCSYNKKIGEPGYNPAADFNQDGVVDVRDLALLGRQFDINVRKVSDRPVFLWHRSNHKNALIRTKIGQPAEQLGFPPYDFLLSAPVDSFNDTYMKIIRRGIIGTGVFAGSPFIVVKGVHWDQLPSEGVLRILTGAFRDVVWKYYFKTAFSGFDDDGTMLIGRSEIFPFDEDFPIHCNAGLSGLGGTFPGQISQGSHDVDVPTNTTVVDLLRQDFTSPAIRLQFDLSDSSSGGTTIKLQFIVGILDMTVPYDKDTNRPEDDLVRGFAPGFTVSEILIQDGVIADGIGADVTSTPAGFRVFKGGELAIPVEGQTEKWNDLEIMFRDTQVWIWWNKLLISPDTLLSGALPSPVTVNTPYFPINPQIRIGKIAARMFPGAVLRNMEIRDQTLAFNEFTYSQLELTS